jgi:hypothetical protein
MANQKISDLTASNTQEGDIVPAIRSGANIALNIGDDLNTIENRVGVLALKTAISEGWTIFDMIDGRADEYEDETGVDTGTSTMVYEGTTDSYDALGIQPSLLLHMDDTGLTDSSDNNHTPTLGGDVARSAVESKFGGYSMLTDNTGDYLEFADDSTFDLSSGQVFNFDWWMNPITAATYDTIFAKRTSSSNGWIVLMNGSGQLEMRVGSNIYTFEGSLASTGSWEHHHISYDGTTLRHFLDGVVTTTPRTSIASITDAGGTLRIGADYSGGNASNMYIDEVKIDLVAGYTTNFTPPTTAWSTPAPNLLLQSQAFTADAEATNGRLVILVEDVDSLTLNTDIIAYISRDGGTTFTAATLVDDGDFSSTVMQLTTGDIDISAQPSGTSMKYKVVNANNKAIKVHGTWFQWK